MSQNKGHVAHTGDLSVPIEERIRARARELGFDAIGFARADVPLEDDFARYEAFVDAGMHGEMGWLANHRYVRRRIDTDHILDGAKSIICLAKRYKRPNSDEAADPPLAQRVARYARGRDYHSFLRRKLRKLAKFVVRQGTAEQPISARALSDDIPILERAWAARAGLGFVGKNGLLIVPGEGSFVLLGEVVTTAVLTPDSPISERCGSCTRCLDVCPTQAFPKPFVLDPRRCIAYLTIEHRSPIEEELRPAIGEHLFGCDDCQTVCPFNASNRPRNPDAVNPFEPHERWSTLDLEALLAIREEEWGDLSAASPVRRATAVGLSRNAALVLGNLRHSAAAPALRRATTEHRSDIVRDAAAWALEQLNSD